MKLQGGTITHTCCCPCSRSCEGARGHNHTQVLLCMEGKVQGGMSALMDMCVLRVRRESARGQENRHVLVFTEGMV